MSLAPGITVAIPTIPPRASMLAKAVRSVMTQSLAPAALSIAVDTEHEGSAITRNRALAGVQTEWVAFLDDDDLMLPNHLHTLASAAHAVPTSATIADIVYALPRVLDENNNLVPRQWDWGGGPVFDPELLRRKAHIQTTCLVRTELAREVGGFAFVRDQTGALNDDHGFFLALLDIGAKFHHVHEETFIWRHHGYGRPGMPGNTSGQGSRW